MVKATAPSIRDKARSIIGCQPGSVVNYFQPFACTFFASSLFLLFVETPFQYVKIPIKLIQHFHKGHQVFSCS